jgi:para-nitrobenzyl esterase
MAPAAGRESAVSVIVETACGRVEGLRQELHEAFLGIPFAEPPVGKLRFLPPQPKLPWPAVRSARAFAPSAIQPKTHNVPGFAASGERSEDCLYLNVYTPRADAKKRPVLFWIHGGGFAYGSGSERFYDGGKLCERGDVVVVTTHYRLGALGFAYLGGHGGASWGAATNAGQLDQIAALRWVKDNIAAFGGDPENVTAFGESAGAVAVAALIAMPGAKGLLRRGVCQSGTANRIGNPETGAAAMTAYLARLGLQPNEAHKLRELAADTLLQAQGEVAGFAPIWGVDTLPERPLNVVRQGGTRGVSLLVGSNRDELLLFERARRPPIDDAELLARVRAALPKKAAALAGDAIDVYRRSRKQRGLPSENLALADAIVGDSRFRIPAVRLTAAKAAHEPAYCYLFTHASPARGGTLGSCHALEIPFVFGSIDQPGTDRFVGSGHDVQRLNDEMMGAWIAFARTGDPSHPGIGAWPSYGRDKATMVFDSARSSVETPPFAEELAIWEQLL